MLTPFSFVKGKKLLKSLFISKKNLTFATHSVQNPTLNHRIGGRTKTLRHNIYNLIYKLKQNAYEENFYSDCNSALDNGC